MRSTLFIIIIVCASFGYAQGSGTIYYHLDKITIKQKSSKDSTRRKKAEEYAIANFRLNGYTGVSLRDSTVKRNNVHYYYNYQNQFKKIHLFEKGKKLKSVYTGKNLLLTIDRINKRIKELENNGYPFAQLKVIDQKEEDNTLSLTYKIDSGDFFIIDKIHIKSKSQFHEKTILNTIGIKPGDTYNEEKIRATQAIFNSTNLYSLTRSTEVLFKKGKAELYIYIEKKKSSDADGYVGFQQDRITERLVLNGYINLQLENAFNRAEKIRLNWRNNPDQTQELKTILELPFLFGSPLGIGTNIDLQKQDTSFVRSDLLFELIYRNPQFRVSLFDQIENSSTITSEPIPGFRDFSKNTIGISVQYRPFLNEKLKFYHPKLTLTGGVFNYRADTLDDNKRKISNNKYLLKYEHQVDFLRFFHLNNSIQYEGLSSSVGLSRNEFIFFGGLQSVRGFYELELAGRNNWIIRNEVEFKPIELLSIKVLYDYSNFNNEIQNFTHSFGAGFGLTNNSSQLEIIIANGRLNNNPIDLPDTKVHIGFKSSF